MKMIFIKRWLFSLMLMVVLSVSSLAATPSDNNKAITGKVDEIFAQWNRPESPGCALAIVKDGQIIYKRGYGMADLEHNVPISATSVFDIGSVSKQFTAMSILILAKQGKLSLDDDINKHLPEMPKYSSPVTIRHLLHHTSGIRDYLTLMYLANKNLVNHYPEDEIIKLIARQKELNFKPGDEHLYSNSGYFLLGVIVKRASGKSLRKFADENIFNPLGMKNTHFHDDFSRIVKDRAIGYSPNQFGGFRIDMSNFDVVGDGAMLTTVEDLYLWDQNFYQNRLAGGGPELIDQLLTVGVLNNGKKLTYASGIIVDQYKGLKLVSHGGAWVGYRADMIRFPEQRLSVICLANTALFNPSAMAFKVAELYLGDSFKANNSAASTTEKPKNEFITLPPAELNARAGLYFNADRGTKLTISVAEDKYLIIAAPGFKFKAAPLSKDKYAGVDTPVALEIAFEQSQNNRPVVIIRNIPGQPPLSFEAFEPIKLTAEQLNEFAGEYFSEELDIKYNFIVKDDKLVLKTDGDSQVLPFSPLTKDQFDSPVFAVKFQRGKDNRIESITLAAGRVKNIRFVKR